MGESGALGNTQAYSTHSENPSANQISPSIATDETFGLAKLRGQRRQQARRHRIHPHFYTVPAMSHIGRKMPSASTSTMPPTEIMSIGSIAALRFSRS